jgi:RHS repeat-associated protein
MDRGLKLGLGYHDYRARYYDPSLWHGTDPESFRSPNWTPYRYCFNNPIIIIDPDGRYELDEVVITAKRDQTWMQKAVNFLNYIGIKDVEIYGSVHIKHTVDVKTFYQYGKYNLKK